MFEDFLNHTCNIYHLEEESVEIGYGIAASDREINGSEPDEKEVRCHFHIKASGEVRVIQKEPYRSIEGEIKLSLPIGTDIRVNDIVEDCKTGVRYRAGIPREIHGGHHLIVMLASPDGMEAAL